MTQVPQEPASKLEEKIKSVLSGRGKTCIAEEDLKKAAVLIPIFKKGDEYYILFTKRTEKVRSHKGQISFPGGRQDQDEDPLATALREAKEEMGIEEKDVQIMGELDDMYTLTSDYCIAPYVGLIPYPYPFKINRHEIEEVIEVPFSALMDESKFREEYTVRKDRPISVYFFQYKRHTIWGATARILKQLLDLLSEKDKKT